MRSSWHVAVVEGPDAGVVLALPERGEVVLGRGAILTDPYLSRRQLRVRVRGRRIEVCTPAGARPVTPTGGAGPGLTGLRPRRRDARTWSTWPAGHRLRAGSSDLELRRRPTALTVPVPPTRRAQVIQAVMAPLMLIALVAALAVSVRTGSRGGAGLLMSAPLLLMALSRLCAPGGSWAGGGPAVPRAWSGRVTTGWRGREADPASLLLALAASAERAATREPAGEGGQVRTGDDRAGSPSRSSSRRRAAHGDSAAVTAWTGRRRRRDLLRLEADDDVALTGATAAAAVRWWTAQVLSRSGPAVGQCRGGVTLTWEAGNATARARLRPSTAEAPAPGASRMVRAPQDEPRVSDTWWRAVLALAAMSGAIDTAGAVSSQGGGVKEQGLPPMVRLEEASGDIDRERLRLRWTAPQAAPHRLPAVIGVGPAGAVSIDLVSHGPHALLAGTTGSGKSELLTSWLVQLAMSQPPERLSLVLVDYKGGAALGALADLPHTAGVLTDLDQALTTRALTSLQAEVRRREQLLAAHGAKDVLGLPAGQAPPRLVIAVDEFATLAASHPEVLDSLLRVAAQGRSLGIHLILATQRPAGAVSPVIRANTALRVCLRVLDAIDSRDVLGIGAAAALSSRPGRLLVAGVDDLDRQQALQAPWCGSPEHLAHLVGEISAAAHGPARSWRPWAPPLPERVTRARARALHPNLHAPGSQLLMGVTDLPEDQATGLWHWDPDTCLLVLGSPASGRSTALASICVGMVARGRAVHLCGPGAEHPALAPGAPGMATTVGADDPRRLARLWTLAAAGLLGGDVLAIDGAEALIPAVDEALGPGEGHGLLEAMCRACPASGTGLVVSGPLNASAARWAAGVRRRLVLGAGEPSEAALAGLPRGRVTGRNPGRGILLTGGSCLECQVVLPDEGERGRPVVPAIALAPLPLHPRSAHSGTWALGGDLAQPLPVPPGPILVIGPPGSGRSNALRALNRAVRAQNQSAAVARAGEEPAGAASAGTAPDGCGRGGPLVVDDLDRADPDTQSRVDQALAAGRRVLASCTTERASTAYRGPLAEMRQRGALVVLWPALGPVAQLVGTSVKAACDPRAPTAAGRGLLAHQGVITPLQILHHP